MFLRRLRLRNIRSIAELDLPFAAEGKRGRAWTYLLGENGTGKSSVLRSVALVLAGSDSAAELVGNPDHWIRLGEQGALIELDFATQDGEPRTARLEFKLGQSLVDFLQYNRAGLEPVDAAVERADRNYFVVGYGVSRRASGGSFAEKSSYRARRARAIATLFNAEASLVSLEQWAMDLDYRTDGAGLDAVKQTLDTLLPDVQFKGIDRNKRSLLFDTPDGVLPLAALSDGYQAMAAWCGDLLWQITETFQDHREPLQARGLLLVDELDLHLHPLWQRKLVEFLKETLPNIQVLVTTHSPLTVHQAGEQELFVLQRHDDNQVKLLPYEGAPNRLMLHQLLQSPLFGLATMDSPQVESLRDELRQLQGIGDNVVAVANAPKRKQRIEQIESELSDLPDWSSVPPSLQRTNEVLDKIAAELGAGAPEPS